MLLVADVQNDKRRAMAAEEEALFGIDKLNVPRSSVPAITHVDYSARIQTVHDDTNPKYHASGQLHYKWPCDKILAKYLLSHPALSRLV